MWGPQAFSFMLLSSWKFCTYFHARNWALLRLLSCFLAQAEACSGEECQMRCAEREALRIESAMEEAQSVIIFRALL